MPTLLLVSHTPSDNTLALRDASVNGITHPDLDNITLISKSFQDTHSEDVLNCDGIMLVTTENFGSMAGLTKDFFERIYYQCIEKTQGLAFALCIRAGQDGSGAKRKIESITTGLKWKLAQDILILKGSYQENFTEQVNELSMNFAAGLEAGLY